MAFKASFLGSWFTNHVILKDAVSETERPFDVHKLTRYHHSLHPGEVNLNHSHPLSEWLDKLRDHTGCHSLSPPPLIPYISYGGTILHALSCALIGYEMYWHALCKAILQKILENSRRNYYAKLLPGGSEELDEILRGVRIDGSAPAGFEVTYHPLLLHIASHILGRVVVLLDPWAPRGSAQSEWPATCGIFEPEFDDECHALPPLCIAWENAQRCVSLCGWVRLTLGPKGDALSRSPHTPAGTPQPRESAANQPRESANQRISESACRRLLVRGSAVATSAAGASIIRRRPCLLTP